MKISSEQCEGVPVSVPREDKAENAKLISKEADKGDDKPENFDLHVGNKLDIKEEKKTTR